MTCRHLIVCLSLLNWFCEKEKRCTILIQKEIDLLSNLLITGLPAKWHTTTGAFTQTKETANTGKIRPPRARSPRVMPAPGGCVNPSLRTDVPMFQCGDTGCPSAPPGPGLAQRPRHRSI